MYSRMNRFMFFSILNSPLFLLCFSLPPIIFYYCIGSSNIAWSTSIIPLDQYQEKLQERRREWEASQPVEPEDRRESH